MLEKFKNVTKIILKLYKEEKITEEETVELLDATINDSNVVQTIPYPVYPTNPLDRQITWNTGEPYCQKEFFTTTTNTFKNG